MPLKTDTSKHLKDGQKAEEQAEEFLLKQGLRLITKNYRCYHGEIDLIMKDRNYLVFVEVRKRAWLTHGNAIESVTRWKAQKIIKSAQHYLQKSNLLYKAACRFDIIGIHPVGGRMTLEWVRDAFCIE